MLLPSVLLPRTTISMLKYQFSSYVPTLLPVKESLSRKTYESLTNLVFQYFKSSFRVFQL